MTSAPFSFPRCSMAALSPHLIATQARYWDILGLVVVITPTGRKLKRCAYVGNDNYLDHSTWLQVPFLKPLSLHPPQFTYLLHDKQDALLSVCVGVINVDDMHFHEDTLAVYSGGVSEVISHLRYTLSAPPSIPSPDKPQEKEADVGWLLQEDFNNGCRLFATLQDTLPTGNDFPHPFHMLRSVDHGKLTFHHCLTKQRKNNPTLRATEARYPGDEFHYFDGRLPLIECMADVSQDHKFSSSYKVLDHPERYQRDARAVSKDISAFHGVDDRKIDLRSIPTVMDGALVRIEFRICGEARSSMVAQVTKLVLMYPKLV